MGGDSVLLMRPEGPVARVRIILDHDPGYEVLLPLPARRDVVYVQQGDRFLAFPGEGANLPRFISLLAIEKWGDADHGFHAGDGWWAFGRVVHADSLSGWGVASAAK